MPSSRRLAEELSVSRVTTIAAFDQLIAEGYLEPRQGAGTFIAQDLPHTSTPKPQTDPPPNFTIPQSYSVFHAGIPDLKPFPYRQWARHLERSWRNPSDALLNQPDPAGWQPLRAEIANHLGAWRGIHCNASQVFITSGAVETFELIGSALLSPGDLVCVEDPGYAPMQNALSQVGLQLQHCPVDDAGFDLGFCMSQGAAQAAIVTPSRQYPLGTTMPLGRRLALLDWAQKYNALIVEDDYDGEFRYQGQPLPALSALDDQGRVLYVGSFSKLFSPHLRIGYLVAPSHLVPDLNQMLAKRGSRASMIAQPALATFMNSGEFSIHLRRMRRLYAARQRHLLCLISSELSEYLECTEDPAGMHLVCGLGPKLLGRTTDTEISHAAKQIGLTVRAISDYTLDAQPRRGLILGYAGFDDAALTNGVEKLAALLKRMGT